MGFETYGPKGSSGGSNVDFDALNKYVVAEAGLEEKSVLLGYVSAIVDLGIHKEADGRKEFTGSPAELKKHLKENKDNWSETEGDKTFVCWEGRKRQAVTIAIDFPDIIIDKGQFFKESKPLPLRLWIGGQFYTKTNGMVVGRPIFIRENKKLGDWSLSTNSMLYKMGEAAKLLDDKKCFPAGKIDQLLGKTFQFEAQVWFEQGEAGKEYYNEYVRFTSAKMKGMPDLEMLTDPILIQFNKENSEEDLKMLRSYIVNTIKLAENYELSKIKKQLEALGSSTDDDSSDPSNPTGGDENDDSDEDGEGIDLELEAEEEEEAPKSAKPAKKAAEKAAKPAKKEPAKKAKAMTLPEFKEFAKAAKAEHGEEWAMQILSDFDVDVKTTLGRSMSAVPAEKYQDIVDTWKEGPQPDKSLFDEEADDDDEWDDPI